MVDREEAIFWYVLQDRYIEQNPVPIGFTDLEMRRIFHRNILTDELTSWDMLSRHRPNMPELYSRAIEKTRVTAVNIARQRNRDVPYSEYMLGNKLKLVFIEHANTLSYCFHCSKIVDKTPEHLCPVCWGWWLLEMDSRNLDDIPSVPVDTWVVLQLRMMPPQLPNLRDDALDSFTVAENVDGRRECVICKKRLREGKVVKKTICDHVFHKRCIKTWLVDHTDGFFRRCPICNTPMPTDDPLYNILLRVRAIEENRPVIPPTP